MKDLTVVRQKPSRLVIGLMSGTSADGIDAVLTVISGSKETLKVRQLSFVYLPFDVQVRQRILKVAEGDFGGARELCCLDFLLGELYTDACLALCRQAGVSPEEIDLVGNHGQTVWHMPMEEVYLGHALRGTLQIGEDAVIAQALGCPVVGDFRVRDLAAGGLGAPLVPYADYLLYHDPSRSVALQNIGGIGNITILPGNAGPEGILAFDTGPGNMVMDALAFRLTGGEARFDTGGKMAASGRVSPQLLEHMMQDAYLYRKPPKTTGREAYGSAYVDRLLAYARMEDISLLDVLSTATRFTAETIAYGIRHFSPVYPKCLVVGGGGSHNQTLLDHLRECLPGMDILTNEDMGYDSDAKEAVAFAVLANEAVMGVPNNMPSATGASGPVVMGKISQ